MIKRFTPNDTPDMSDLNAALSNPSSGQSRETIAAAVDELLRLRTRMAAKRSGHGFSWQNGRPPKDGPYLVSINNGSWASTEIRWYGWHGWIRKSDQEIIYAWAHLPEPAPVTP